MPRKGFFRRLAGGLRKAFENAFAGDYEQLDQLPPQPKPQRKRKARTPARPLGQMPDKLPGEGIFGYRERLQDRAVEQVYRWSSQGYLPTYHPGRIRDNMGKAEFQDLEEFFTMSVEDYRVAAARKPAIFGYK